MSDGKISPKDLRWMANRLSDLSLGTTDADSILEDAACYLRLAAEELESLDAELVDMVEER